MRIIGIIVWLWASLAHGQESLPPGFGTVGVVEVHVVRTIAVSPPCGDPQEPLVACEPVETELSCSTTSSISLDELHQSRP